MDARHHVGGGAIFETPREESGPEPEAAYTGRKATVRDQGNGTGRTERNVSSPEGEGHEGGIVGHFDYVVRRSEEPLKVSVCAKAKKGLRERPTTRTCFRRR